MGLVEKARAIAERAHEGQVRKSDGTPYIAHPIAVAEILAAHNFSETVIAAGLVHDVLEDTDVSEAELRAELGNGIVDIVTAVSEDTDLEWEERKLAYVVQVAESDGSVKAVSVADKIHNAQSLIEAHGTQGAAVWQKFNRGKEKKLWFEQTLLTHLKMRWQHPLLETYEQLVQQMEQLA